MELKDLEIMVNLGVNGSGKTTLAGEFLKDGGEMISFGQPLRDVIGALVKEDLDDKEKYEKLKRNLKATITIAPNDQDGDTYLETLTLRNLLERAGDALKLAIDPKILLKCAKKSLKNLLKKGVTRLASDDVRIPMEFDFYYNLKKKGYNVKFFWCNYVASHKYDPNSTHLTEKQAQFILRNYKLEHRQEIPDEILADIQKRRKEILKEIKNASK